MTNPLHNNPLLFWLLDGSVGPAPTQRADVYTRLVRNNLHEVVFNAFPMVQRILTVEEMESLVDRFLTNAGPTTFFYRDIPRDFLHWAEAEAVPYADLLSYEWLQFEAARHPADLASLSTIDDDFIRPNPTMQVGVYERPVHTLDGDTPNPDPFAQPMAYLVWRRPTTDEVVFHRVGLGVARALGLASTQPQALEDLCATLETEGTLSSAEDALPRLTTVFSELRMREGLL